MKPNAAKSVEQWHAEKVAKSDTFNFKKELVAYCSTDVDILIKSIMIFRNQFKATSGIDPLTRCFTLASIGLEVFRAKLLPPKLLAITPIQGYSNPKINSKSANSFLDLM